MPLGDTLHGLVLLVAILIGSRVVGGLFVRIRQPFVLGSITLGIVVGGCLASCPESVVSELVSRSSRGLLDAVGTAGLLLLMFSVGTKLRGFERSDDAKSRWTLVPFALLPIVVCAAAARPFTGRLDAPGEAALHYGWVFVGIALGVTAVPVLVMIVDDLGIGSLPLARSAIRIAVLTDGLAWLLVTLLALLTHTHVMSIPSVVIGIVLLAMVVVVLPRLVTRSAKLANGNALVATMVVAALAGAAATQLLGLHPAIGAVIAGLSFPAGLFEGSSRRDFGTVVDILLPAFFVSVAMAVPLNELGDDASWGGLACAAVLTLAAFVSKLGTGWMFGALHRWPRRQSAGLGVLLNCRGVTEIAIASVGLQSGLIGPFAFTVLCGIAVLTTAATAPLYRGVHSVKLRSRAAGGSGDYSSSPVV